MESTPRYIFKDAIKEDIDKMVAIEEDCFSDAWSKESFESCLMSPFYNVVVVFCDEKLIAYGIMKCMYEDGELVRIAVTPKFRRKQIGYNLLNWLLKIASHEGVENAFLDVRESNKDAIAMYEKIGFVSYEVTESFYSSPTESSIKMKIELKGS